MADASGTSATVTGDDNALSTPNPYTRVAPTDGNPSGYPPFDIANVVAYTNKQLQYYQITGALLTIDADQLIVQTDRRKKIMQITKWDGNTRETTPEGGSTVADTSASRVLSFEEDSEPDSVCARPPPGRKGIKFNASDVTKLHYNSKVAQFTNWLQDLKAAFDGDPAKFPYSRQKIIFATMTLDEQLKTTYNSATQLHPGISTHWRKFKRWAEDTVLHQGSDRQKAAMDFTTARQRVEEDPNEFYIRLFNLGVQSKQEVTVEGYKTRLVGPLLNLLNRSDRTYKTVQDVVTHAARLWHTLDPEKVRQEIREDRARRQRLAKGQNQNPKLSTDRGQQQQQSQSPRGAPQTPRRRNPRPRLTDEEHQFRIDNNRCLKCGWPGHIGRNCEHAFNPNRVTLRNDNNEPAKAQPLRGQKRPRPTARANPARVSEDSDANAADSADESFEDEPEPKRSKN